MRLPLAIAATLTALLLLVPAARADEKLQMGVSVDVVPVTSDFSGRDIVVFGAIETDDQASLYRGEYQMIIEVIGALEEAIVRKKERIGGIWVNAEAREYRSVPSFYTLLTDNELVNITDLSFLNAKGIGIDNLQARPVGQNSVQSILTESEFSGALRRIRIEQSLFTEDLTALRRLSPSLWRARLSLPPNVPIGEHLVRAHLFKDGKKLDQVETKFEVRKIGFERWIYDLAHEQSLIYGILCVLLAIFTGWSANVIFRKN